MAWLRATRFFLAVLTFASAVYGQCDVTPLRLVWGNTTVTGSGLGVSRGIEVGIGTPNQIFAFRPSTNLNNTRINNVLSCGSDAVMGASNDTCVGGLGGVFDLTKSSTYTVSIKARWNGSEIDDESSSSAYVYFNDNVGFQRTGAVEGFPAVLDSKLWGGAQSSLPLGTNSSFLEAAVKGGVAPSEAWGLWSGSRSVAPVDGSLVVGGYDKARIGGDFRDFPTSAGNLQRACPLQVTVTDITFEGQSLFVNSSEKSMVACVEPNTQRNVFTPALSQAFGNLTAQNATYRGMTYPVETRPSGDMIITIDGTYNTTITNFELFNPLRGSDQNGRYAITNDSVVEAGVADNRNQNTEDVNPTLGGLFLTFNYLVVDYSRNHFRLAPAIASEIGTDSDLATICTSAPAAKPSTTNVGAIAGGTVGGVFGILLVAALVYVLVRAKRQKRNRALDTQHTKKSPNAEIHMVDSTPKDTTVEMDTPDHVQRVELPTALPSVRKTSRPDWLQDSEISQPWDGQRLETQSPPRYR